MYDYSKLISKKVWQELLRLLPLIYKTLARAKTDITYGMIDTTTVDSFEFMKYMSTTLRRKMRKKGIRINMKWRDQDYKRKRGPKFKLDLRKYSLRFLLKRTNGWLKSFRSIRMRRSYHPAMFKAFTYLALIIILIRYS